MSSSLAGPPVQRWARASRTFQTTPLIAGQPLWLTLSPPPAVRRPLSVAAPLAGARRGARVRGRGERDGARAQAGGQRGRGESCADLPAEHRSPVVGH
jgi:hypothetical protein